MTKPAASSILTPRWLLRAARKLAPQPGPVVILSTAHPAKFPDAVKRAIGQEPAVPAALQKVMNLPEKLEILPNDLALIRQYISSRLAA